MPTPELSYQEVEELLDAITHNKYLQHMVVDDRDTFVIFSFPTALESIEGRYLYKKTLLEAKKEGLPSIKDVDTLLLAKGVIPEEEREKLAFAEGKLVAQRKLLELTKIPGRRAPIEEVIKRYEKDVFEIKAQRETYYYMSCERKADEEILLYLAWAGTYKPEAIERYWKTYQDFQEDTDLFLRNEIIRAFSKFNRGLPVETLRFLARHNLWRIRYVSASKLGGPLFCRGLEDLTPDQLSLLYWSNFYQSIYEMMPDDQPDDSVIKDDEALDSHMEMYFKKREEERKDSKNSKRGVGSQSKLDAWDKGDELIITPAHPAYHDLQYSEERLKNTVTESADVVIRTQASNPLKVV